MKLKSSRAVLGALVGGLFASFSGLAMADADLDKAVNTPGAWPIATGGYYSQHNSPLAQINKSNVKNVKAAWSFPLVS